MAQQKYLMQQAISAGHQKTLDTAKEILHAGGNAFDAAIAAHLTMFVAEPCMASAGGGGFAMTFRPEYGMRFVDFFCHTPRQKIGAEKSEFYPIEVDFGKDTEQFFIGAGSVATPGTMAGLFHLQANFGSMPFKELAAIPMQLAKEGVAVDKFHAIDFGLLQPILSHHQEGRDIFCHSDAMKQEGDIIELPQMHDFLEFMISEGRDGFYHGEIGAQIAAQQAEKNGLLTRADFENYQVHETKPLSFDYRSQRIHTASYPSLGGIILANYLASVQAHSKSQTIKRLVKNLLDINYQVGAFDKHYDSSNLSIWKGNISTKGTSHFNILDKWGNAIALTTSIGEGNGTFIKGTQMQLNNMLGELFLLPDGAHSWLANQRLNSMMTPTMVTDHRDDLKMILGSGGASRIPFALGQGLQYVYEDHLSLEEAIEAPRMHFHDQKLQAEFPAAIKGDSIKDVKFWEQKHMFFGGINAIQKLSKTCYAHADSRRYGSAEVF